MTVKPYQRLFSGLFFRTAKEKLIFLQSDLQKAEKFTNTPGISAEI